MDNHYFEPSIEEIQADIKKYELYTLVDEEEIAENTNLSIFYEKQKDRVVICVTRYTDEDICSGTTAFETKKFLNFTQRELDLVIGETLYYAQPIEEHSETEYAE